MKKMSLILTLCTAIPLAVTACKKDDDSGGDGDGDGDGSGGVAIGGDGDGDGTGGMAGDGDGDGDETGGMAGDGDGDTGGTAMGGDGMGGAMGGMGGGTGDLATNCTTSCTVIVAVGCAFMTSQTLCEAQCNNLPLGCESEAEARIACEAGLQVSDWECNQAGGNIAGYSTSGEAECGEVKSTYDMCVMDI